MSILSYTPESEISSRIGKLQATLEQHDLDGALIVQHTNLFYFSGTSQNGHLFVPRSGKPLLRLYTSIIPAL